MTTAASTLACAGCAAPVVDGADPYPFRCPRAAELPDVDHVVRRTLDVAADRMAVDPHDNPFLRYRRFLHSYHFARERGIADAAYVELVARLDEAVARVDGRGFSITPFGRSPELETQLGIEPHGSVWVKDETRNVSGSHKARHLMGLMIYLQVVESLGLDRPRQRELAIASCGNAALAAAVIARAANYSLRVFVPAAAEPAVVRDIRRLGARVDVCAREPGEKGDPSVRRFLESLVEGALPFCCQGNLNGLTIDGGATLGYEMAEALGDSRPDRLLLQVGGGALASSCIQAFADTRRIAGGTLPTFYAVQTRGAYPLKRAFDLVRERMTSAEPLFVDVAMRHARTHRSAFMRPWEVEPRSIAEGILDDETYDWAAVVEGMLRGGGSPLVVSEQQLRRANAIAHAATGSDVDYTGSAGLAGLLELIDCDAVARRQCVAVIFSGARRVH